jgi:hypothetical protein
MGFVFGETGVSKVEDLVCVTAVLRVLHQWGVCLWSIAFHMVVPVASAMSPTHQIP